MSKMPLELVWNNLIEGSVRVVLQPVVDTVSSPTKQSKGLAKSKAAAAAAASPVSADPMPRSRGFMFSYKDMVYVVGGDDAGTLECLSAPAVSGARPASPVKKGGSKKFQEATAAAASAGTGGGTAAASSFLVHPCSGKAPPPRKYFAACCNYGSSNSTEAVTTSGGGGLSHQHTRHAHATSVPQQNAPHSVLVTCGWSLAAGAALDDVWELKLPQFSWSQVAVKSPALPKRYGHAAVHVGGKLYVFGGFDPKADQTLGDFWVLDDHGGGEGGGRRWLPAIGQGECSGSVANGLDDDAVFRMKRPCARQQHSMAVGPRGMVFLYGGLAANGEVLNDLWYLHATHSVNLVTVDTFGRVETFPNPLLVWRQVVVPDATIPRRCGATLVVSNVPEGAGSGRARRRSTKLVDQDGGDTDATFLLMVCGGWDSAYNNPFRATIGTEAPADGDMLRRKSSTQLYRSDTLVMSFRKSDLVEAPLGGDGDAGPSGVSGATGGMGASGRRRSSTAVRFRSVVRNRLKSLADSPPIPAPPSVIVFLAHIGPAAQDDGAARGANFADSVINLDVPVVAEHDSVSCGSATPQPRAISLHRGTGAAGAAAALPRPTVSNVSAKVRAMFSSVISRSLDAPATCIPTDLQLTIEAVDCREIGSDAPSVQARSAMSESAMPASPSKSVRGARAGDAKLSAASGGGASASHAAPIASEMYSRRNIPVAAEGSMWCRGFGSRTHVLCFGGEMTPLVLRSDLWRGEIGEHVAREPFETAFFAL